MPYLIKIVDEEVTISGTTLSRNVGQPILQGFSLTEIKELIQQKKIRLIHNLVGIKIVGPKSLVISPNQPCSKFNCILNFTLC